MPIGFHISKDGSEMRDAFREGIEFLREYVSAPCAQIFATGPQGRAETLSEADKVFLHEYSAKESVPFVVHGSYVDAPWVDARHVIPSMQHIRKEMMICDRIGAAGLVVHSGWAIFESGRLNTVFAEMSKLPRHILDGRTMFIEINSEKAKPTTLEKTANLVRLFDEIDDANNCGAAVGLCIDTAHLHSLGMDIGGRAGAERWIEEIEAVTSSVPVVIHFNDSQDKLGGGQDRHAAIGAGQIWGEYGEGRPMKFEQSGAAAFLDWAEDEDLMIILERKKKEDVEADLLTICKYGAASCAGHR